MRSGGSQESRVGRGVHVSTEFGVQSTWRCTCAGVHRLESVRVCKSMEDECGPSGSWSTETFTVIQPFMPRYSNTTLIPVNVRS